MKVFDAAMSPGGGATLLWDFCIARGRFGVVVSGGVTCGYRRGYHNRSRRRASESTSESAPRQKLQKARTSVAPGSSTDSER